jgi:hypothetical protein
MVCFSIPRPGLRVYKGDCRLRIFGLVQIFPETVDRCPCLFAAIRRYSNPGRSVFQSLAVYCRIGFTLAGDYRITRC